MNIIDNEIKKKRKRIKDFPIENRQLINNIVEDLKKSVDFPREIMYSDIINWIVRKNHRSKKYNQLLLWCNYKIRFGEEFVDLR
jgi:hypothetical protein